MTDKPDRAEVEGMRWMYLCRQPNDGVYFLRNTPSDAFENIDMILVPDQSATLAAALRDAEAQLAEARADKARFDLLISESWDLRCFDIPTGGGDYEIGWRVIGHWQEKPTERLIAEVFKDDPRKAIDEARAALEART